MGTLARRFPRLSWFAAGLVFTLATGAVRLYWLEIFGALLGPLSWDTRPAWLRVLMTLLEWLPWVGLAAVEAARFRHGRFFRPVAYFAGMAALYVSVTASVFLGPAAAQVTHARHFDTAAWRSNPGSDTGWPARLRMVDDLLQHHDLHGLARPQVERLLGPADDTDYFRDWDMVYWLGPERGLVRIDSEWLVVRLGRDGRVTEYRTITD
jgi:hypothetical protein